MIFPSIVFWGGGGRAANCLKKLMLEGCRPEMVVVDRSKDNSIVRAIAGQANIPILEPSDLGEQSFINDLKRVPADMYVLAGYGRILTEPLLSFPKWGAINLHAGKLPQFRGSSPLNWALIRGERSVTLSVIKVAPGVDSGDVLAEVDIPVSSQTTIHDLHEAANLLWPDLLFQVVQSFAAGDRTGRVQCAEDAAYYPLRFPGDGCIFWDVLTAEQVLNRIRALTRPYPGAFSFWKGHKISIWSAVETSVPHYGEPGRIYRVSAKGAVVCASDKCIRIQEASFEDGRNALPSLERYSCMGTLREAALAFYQQQQCK